MKRKYYPKHKEVKHLYRQLTPKDCNFLEFPELGIDDPYEDILNAYKNMPRWWHAKFSLFQELERPTFIRRYCEV